MRLRGEIGASSSRCEQETSTEQLPVCQADSDYKLREAAPGEKVPPHSCHRDRLHLRTIQSHHWSSGIRGGFSPAMADSKQS